MKALTYAFKRESDGASVALKGAFDERAGAALCALRQALDDAAVVRFDCAEVEPINSVGLRLWVQFLASLGDGHEEELHRCSTYFVDYASMSARLIGRATVRSFHVPYQCRDCPASAEVLMTAEDPSWRGGFAPQTCDACGGTLAAEAEPETYVGFLHD